MVFELAGDWVLLALKDDFINEITNASSLLLTIPFQVAYRHHAIELPVSQSTSSMFQEIYSCCEMIHA